MADNFFYLHGIKKILEPEGTSGSETHVAEEKTDFSQSARLIRDPGEQTQLAPPSTALPPGQQPGIAPDRTSQFPFCPGRTGWPSNYKHCHQQ